MSDDECVEMRYGPQDDPVSESHGSRYWWLQGRIAAADCWAAYQPKGAGGYALSKRNLNGSGNNAADGAAIPTWDVVNGWKFDAASLQYLTTTFVPQNDQSQSVLIQFTNGIDTNYLFGMLDAAARAFYVRRKLAAGAVYANGGSRPGVGAAVAAGNLGIAGTEGYRNGADDSLSTGVYTGVPVSACYIGCYNLAGVATGFISVYIQALAIYSVTITVAQVAAVAAAMAAL